MIKTNICPLRWQGTLIPTLATISVLTLLISLGYWQLHRATQKETILQSFVSPNHIKLRSTQLLQEKPLNQLQYQRIKLHGYFQNNKTFLQDNRINNSIVGFYIFTPFYDTDIHQWLLINRGFTARKKNQSRLAPIIIPSINTTGQIKVILNNHLQESLLLGKNSEIMQDGKYLIQDLRLSTIERLLQIPLIHASGLLIWPKSSFSIKWKPNVTISPERHRAYAFQWFSMAIVLVIIYCKLNITFRKPI